MAGLRLKRALRFPVALGALLLALVGPAVPASAHAQLVDTSPAHGSTLEEPPERIELRFNEPVTVSSVSMRSGEASVPGEARPEGSTIVFEPAEPIPDGTAVVEWQVVSADGHPIVGTLVFHVRFATEADVAEPEAQTASGGLIVANALMYVGLLIGGGLALFAVHVHRGGTRSSTLRRFTVVLLAVGVLGTVATLTWRAAGVGFDPWPAGSLPAVGAVVAGAALAIAGYGRVIPVTVGVAIALLAPALTGHTRSFEPTWLLVGSDLVHLYAGAVWAGGLAAIAIVTRADRSEIGPMVRRFSRIAGWCLAAVLVSGSALAWTLHGSRESILGTDHGRLILVKVGLVLAVGAIGAFNRFRLIPALAAAGAKARTLANTTAVEAVGLVLVLVVAAALVDKDPAGADPLPAGAQGPVQTAIGDLGLTLELDPSARGVNEARIVVRTPDGEPAELIDSLTVAVVGEGDRTTFDAVAGADGHVATIDIPGAGEWLIEVRARDGAFSEAVASLTFDTSTGLLTPTTGLAVSGAVMPTLSGAPSAAVYMSVVSERDDQLVEVSSPACDEASLHETVIGSDGTASMEPRPVLEMRAGEPLRMESGGLHVMCEGPSVEVGDTVPFSLVTASGERLDFIVPVVNITDTLD